MRASGSSTGSSHPSANPPGGLFNHTAEVDTGLDSPDDIVDWRAAPPHTGSSYRAEARSVVMLFAEGASLEATAPSPRGSC